MARGTGYGITLALPAGPVDAEIQDVNHGGMSRESIDFTHNQSAPGPDFGWMEKEPGDIVDPGQLELSLSFNPEHLGDWISALTAAKATGTITYKDGTAVSAEMFLVEFGNEAPHNDRMTADATFEITGEISV